MSIKILIHLLFSLMVYRRTNSRFSVARQNCIKEFFGAEIRESGLRRRSSCFLSSRLCSRLLCWNSNIHIDTTSFHTNINSVLTNLDSNSAIFASYVNSNAVFANIYSYSIFSTNSNIYSNAIFTSNSNVNANTILSSDTNINAYAIFASSTDSYVDSFVFSSNSDADIDSFIFSSYTDIYAYAILTASFDTDSDTIFSSDANINANAFVTTDSDINTNPILSASTNIDSNTILSADAYINTNSIFATSADIDSNTIFSTYSNIDSYSILSSNSDIYTDAFLSSDADINANTTVRAANFNTDSTARPSNVDSYIAPLGRRILQESNSDKRHECYGFRRFFHFRNLIINSVSFGRLRKLLIFNRKL